MKRFVLFIVILIAMNFLGSRAPASTPENDCSGKALPVTPLGPKRSGPRVSFTDMSGLENQLRLVIRDREAFTDIWKRIYSRNFGSGPVGEVPPLPDIDFSKEMVVVAAMGGRPTSGYNVVIDGACEHDNRLEVAVRNTSPGKSCFNLQVQTSPVDLVRMPKTNLEVVFREIQVVNECR